ncbi:MAG: toprim domain-containing protein [Thermoplasmata archaeon]|jgi:dTMP kinase
MRDGRDSDEALEEFLELWDKIRSDSVEEGAVVVVEGERDRRALRRLGLEGPIALVHRGLSLSATAHRLLVQGRRVIVLTDWDREGGQLARRLREFLDAEQVPLDLEYRRRLARVLRGELAQVEGLYGWARRLAERQGRSLEQLLSA